MSLVSPDVHPSRLPSEAHSIARKLSPPLSPFPHLKEVPSQKDAFRKE